MSLHMTRSRTYVLTAIAVVLYIGLGIVFADGFFTGTFWKSDDIFGSSFLSWLLLIAIVVAGALQARSIPAAGITVGTGSTAPATGQVDDPAIWKLLVGNTYLAIIWMPLRFFVAQQWLSAGEEKLRSDAWMSGGTALKGFWTNATATPATGKAPITFDWFRKFLQFMIDHQWYTWFAKVIALGETLVGLGLLFGALVGIAAFFGTVLNFNFLLAGTTSTNPVLFGLTIFIVLGWKVAGFVGLDRVLLPLLGTPWKPGPIVEEHLPHPLAGRRGTA